MRLSPGVGSVRYISGNRARPYAVHPPARNGKRPKQICSVSDRATGYAVLRLWHAGKYRPGMEDQLQHILSSVSDPSTVTIEELTEGKVDDLIEKINQESAPTVAEVYEKYLSYRLSPVYTKGTDVNALNSAYTKLEPYHNRPLDSIGIDEWQEVVNEVAEGFSKTTVVRTMALTKNLYKYALVRELCRKDSGLHVEMPVVKEEQHHQDFSDSELEVLWAHKGNPVVKMILVMIYSGFRIGAFAKEGKMEMHLDCEIPYFKGGVKTAAGRGRIVPIHSAILEMVREMDGVYLCGKSYIQFYRDMKRTLVELHIDSDSVLGQVSSTNVPDEASSANVTDLASSANVTDAASAADEECVDEGKNDNHRETDTVTVEMEAAAEVETRYHTPHSTRHTFSRLCESYDVREADRKRLLGHSFGNDITNRVYGHRSIQELKEQIEKIGVPESVPKDVPEPAV